MMKIVRKGTDLAGATEVAKDEAPGLKGVTLRDPNGIAFQVIQRAVAFLFDVLI